MKTAKLLFGTFVVLVFFGTDPVLGQWSFNGTHIYNNNSGFVGIGNNSPASLLHVGKNMTEPAITVQNLGGAGGATYTMMDNVSGANWKFKATNSGGFKIRDHAFGLDVVTIEPNSMANALYINAQGNVGIGTNAPVESLHLAGDATISTSYPFITFDNSTAGGNSGFNFKETGTSKGWMFFYGAADYLLINADPGLGWRTDLVIKSDGRVSIGTDVPAAGYALSVNGKVACEEVLVQLDSNWPDYVFGDDYHLMSLQELEQNIETNNRLPGMPSAAEVQENGFEIADMQKRIVEKIEELTLYTIEQGKQIEALNLKNREQEAQILELRQKLAKADHKRARR